MLALSFLLRTCFPSLWSPPFPLYDPASIPSNLPRCGSRSSGLPPTLRSGVLDRRLCSFFFWKRRLWRTCQLLSGTEATLFFSAGPVYSSFSAEACAILQALCRARQNQQVCHFSSLLLLSKSRSVLSSISPFTAISLADLAGTFFCLLLYSQATMGSRILVSPRERRG